MISWMNATKRSYIVFKGNKKRTNVEREDFNESVLFVPFLTLAVKKKSQGWRAEALKQPPRCSQPRSPLCRLPTSLSSSSRWSGTFCHIKLGDRRLEFVFTLRSLAGRTTKGPLGMNTKPKLVSRRGGRQARRGVEESGRTNERRRGAVYK